MQTRSLLAAAALAALSLSVSAQNLKPGLWEVTSKTSGNPQMEQAMAEMQKQMASMPPAQRKQMEEAMARQGVKMGAASGGGMAMQMCMTIANQRDESECWTVLDRQRIEGHCSSASELGPVCTEMRECCLLQPAGDLRTLCVAQSGTGHEEYCTQLLAALNGANRCTAQADAGAGD